jgi:UDP-N-acetylglucosamine 2-epimerase (non-hydrolysing)
MIVAGTRPELIRLSRIIPALDEACDHTFVWTGQNYDPKLSDVFFEELGVRGPDHCLEIGQGRSWGTWVGDLLSSSEILFKEDRPDKVLILGDTNSAMSAYVAKRMGIPVYHMEAGNRCYDDRVPEEVNRRVVDACSDVLMPYTNRSRDNLLEEGYPARRIHVTGNPIWEVLEHYKDRRTFGGLVDRLGIGQMPYFLVTLHRAENVDDPERLLQAITALRRVREAFEHRMLVSVHPRTRDKLKKMFVPVNWEAKHTSRDGIDWLEPLGFHEFVGLEENAFCVLSDSGTVQEECCLLRTPSVTLRETTERPETIDCGSNVVCGIEPRDVLDAVGAVTQGLEVGQKPDWSIPEEYLVPDVSRRVVKILLSKEAL